MSIRVLLLSFSLILIRAATSQSAPSAANAPAFLNVIPGTTTKAEVDLTFGEPLRKTKPEVEEYEYSPPVEANIFDRVMISYFPDVKQVSRVDAYFKAPHSAEAIRVDMQLGKRVLTRDRSEGGIEELYYPKFIALIFNRKAPDAPVIAVSYLSTRYLADIYISRCNEFLKTKRYSEASDEADKAVVVDPEYSRGYLAQGWYYQSQKNYDEAIVRFLAACSARYPPHSRGEAHSWLGLMYWNHKNLPDKAQEEFGQGISSAPDYYYTHFQYGRFLRAHNQGDRALAEFVRAVELNSARVEPRLELASLYYEKNDFAKAAPQYAWLSRWAESDEALDRDDSLKAQIHFRYAWALTQVGQHDHVLEIYQLSVKRDPHNADALNNIGAEYRTSKNLSKAEEYFRAALKVDPKHLWASRNLGRVLLESGRVEEARRQADATLNLKRDDVLTMIDAAHCWMVQGKKKPALEWIEKAVAAGDHDVNQLMTDPYFESLRNNGDFKKLLQRMR